AKQIAILNNGRLLGSISGESGQLKVDPRVLGLGQEDIQAIALFGNGQLERVVPAPVQITVDPATPLPAIPTPAGSLLPGLMLRLANDRIVPVQDTRDPGWLGANGVGSNQKFAFQAFFDIVD